MHIYNIQYTKSQAHTHTHTHTRTKYMHTFGQLSDDSVLKTMFKRILKTEELYLNNLHLRVQILQCKCTKYYSLICQNNTKKIKSQSILLCYVTLIWQYMRYILYICTHNSKTCRWIHHSLNTVSLPMLGVSPPISEPHHHSPKAPSLTPLGPTRWAVHLHLCLLLLALL